MDGNSLVLRFRLFILCLISLLALLVDKQQKHPHNFSFRNDQKSVGGCICTSLLR